MFFGNLRGLRLVDHFQSNAMTNMKIVAFPKDNFCYNELLYREAERYGSHVVDGVFSGRWLISNMNRGDIAHFHWPSFQYAMPRRVAAIIGFIRWATILLAMRLCGVKIVWSAHNLLPHDRSVWPVLDVWARKLLISISSRIFVHGENARQKLVERFPDAQRKICIIPHGNFVGYYPGAESKDALREQLQIAPTSFAYLFIGLCKPYKNVEELIRQFARVEGDVVLVIAGRFQNRNYEERILSAGAGDPRIRFYIGYIPDDQMHRYLTSCDAVVAPYRETLTSGTAMLAMSFGRPIISVAIGHLLDVVTPAVGELYDPADPAGLLTALEAVRRRPFDEARIIEHAGKFTFEDAARKILSSLESVGNSRRVPEPIHE